MTWYAKGAIKDPGRQQSDIAKIEMAPENLSIFH